MDNVIQQLKDNEKPFGLMSKEMQDKANAIGFHGNFRLYLHPGWGGIIDNPTYGHSWMITYRLRLDYEAKPEIVRVNRIAIEAVMEILQKELDK